MLGKKSAHPTQDELFAYCQSRPKRGDTLVAAHLAACPACTRRLDQFLFDRALGSLSAGPTREINHHAMLRAALVAAAKRAPRAAFKRRVAAWNDVQSPLAGGIVQWLPGDAGSRSRGQVRLVSTFTGTSLWRIEERSAQPAHFSETASTACAGPQAFVHATGPRKLEVQVFHWPTGVHHPLVLLAREVSTGPPILKETRADPKLPTQSACFGNLIPGRYLLGLEPIPAPADSL